MTRKTIDMPSPYLEMLGKLAEADLSQQQQEPMTCVPHLVHPSNLAEFVQFELLEAHAFVLLVQE